MTDTFQLRTIGQIALVVSDVDAATTFYKDTLGLPFLFAAPPKLAFFDLAGIRLMLAEPENAAESDKVGRNSTLYFSVEDIQQAFETLKQRGAVIEGQPHVVARMGEVDLWMAFFRDPDHNLIGLMAEVPVQP